MQAPSADALRDALEAIQAEDTATCERLLDDLLAEGPAELPPYDEISGEDATLATKAWACAHLARERLEQGKLAIVRVTLHSAIDHAEDSVEEGGRVEPGEAGLFG